MEQTAKLFQWIQHFLQESDTSLHSAMFIRNYNNSEFTDSDFRNMLDDTQREGAFYHSFSKDSFHAPYEPFFNAIKFFYVKYYASRMSIEDFVDACGVYSLQKDIFCSYLSSGKAFRHEFIMISEVEFEKQKMLSSVLGCLNYISKEHPVIFFLSHFQYACPSTLMLIREMVEHPGICCARCIAIYDESRSSISSWEDMFDSLILLADDKDLLYELESTNQSIANMEYHSFFHPVSECFGDYIAGLNNLYYTLALDDMDYYIKAICDKINDESLQVSRAQLFDFYAFAALCYFQLDDNNRAMLMNEHMLPLFNINNNLRLAYRYYYICGQIQLGLAQVELCTKYANRCLAIAKELGLDQLVFYAEVLLSGAQFSGWRNVFWMDFSAIRPDERMLERCRQYNFTNTLAHYLVFAYDNDADSIKHFVSVEDSKTFIEAKRIIEELGNTDLLLTLYTKYIVVFTEKGFYKSVDRFYQAKIEIFEHEHNDLRLANLYLGMGYNNIVSENYAEANAQFTAAISLLYQLKKPESIAEGLYNLAVNSICIEDYKASRDYMLTIFKILDELELETIQMCNVTKLYALLAISYYKLGNDYRCFRYVKHMETILSDSLKNIDSSNVVFSRDNEVFFLYFLLEAVMSMSKGNLETAGEFFQRAKLHFAGYSGVLFYAIIFFVTEYHNYFMQIGDLKGAEEILEYGISYCTQNGYSQKAAFFRAKALGKTVSMPKLAHLSATIKLDDLTMVAYHVGKEKQLYRQKNAIRFLASWQELLNHYDSSQDTLMSYTMNSLQDNFNLEHTFFIKIMDGEPRVIYENPKLQDNDLSAIMEFFHVIKREFVVNRTEKTFLEYMYLLKVFHDAPVFTLIGIPIYNETGLVCIFLAASNVNIYERSLMNEDDLGILKTAMSQLNNSLDRIRDHENIIAINQKLNQLAITDNLTGLYNRQGFDKMLSQNASCSDMVSVLYVDLDNFKYCNDTFGHDIGDIVLKEFANLFKRVSKDSGYAVRYGGDEFLIILNNKSIEDAKSVADEIYDYIGDGFHSLISNYLGYDVTIPDEKRLSCSIGIMVSPNGNNANMALALKKADEALYYMKKNSKGHYIAWDDITEFS